MKYKQTPEFNSKVDDMKFQVVFGKLVDMDMLVKSNAKPLEIYELLFENAVFDFGADVKLPTIQYPEEVKSQVFEVFPKIAPSLIGMQKIIFSQKDQAKLSS